MSAEPTIALVGAGPGDLDLLTLDAEAALAAAREVVADRCLASLLDALAAEQPDREADGAPGRDRLGAPVTLVDDDGVAAAELHDAISRGAGVVRLYRGDPWAHPAGDDERAALRAAGVRWSTVAGVLPELAALATAGIPAQVRDRAVTTTFVADGTPGEDELVVPVDPAHTLVVRTPDLAATASRLAGGVEADGLADDRAVALVPATGTEPVRTTLEDIGTGLAPHPGAEGAGVVVVGLVAAIDLRTTASAPAGAGR